MSVSDVQHSDSVYVHTVKWSGPPLILLKSINCKSSNFQKNLYPDIRMIIFSFSGKSTKWIFKKLSYEY